MAPSFTFVRSAFGPRRVLSKRWAAAALAFACVSAVSGIAAADTYYYVAWSAADVAHGTASGTITLPDNSVVTVDFQAINADGSQGNLFGAQINGTGTNYWTPAATWTSTQVQNPPPDPDILQLAGGQNETYKVTLSAPIVDPIMAIVSLGATGTPCTYNFDAPFTIESQGTDMWGGSATSLSIQPNNVLQGTEGSGTIQFVGTYATFSWTVPTPESWHGFTFGIRTTLALDPDAGPPDAGQPDAAGDAAGDTGAEAAATDGGDAAVDASGDASADAGSDAAAVDSGSDATADAGGVTADSGPTADGGSTDAGKNAPASIKQTGGCGCHAAGTSGTSSDLALSWLGLFAALALLRRRRRS